LSHDIFANYVQLVERIDQLCRKIETALSGNLTCHAGCSSCCRSISLFPVEAVVLHRELKRIPVEKRDLVIEKASRQDDGSCPLLHQDCCLLYHVRPIICRTHGLPLLYRHGDMQHVDICPHNNLEGKTLSGADVIDLDRLNTLLVAVNRLYCLGVAGQAMPERISIYDALCKKEMI
jgi:hypothetical protein